MRAAVFKGPAKPWAVETVADPTPGSGEMIVQVQRCGICGSDVHMTSGKGYTAPEGCILGHEYAGEIVAIGPHVSGFGVGDKVAAMPFAGCGTCATCHSGEPLLCERGARGYVGGFAEYVRVAAASTVRLPSSLSMQDGALIEPLAVGLHAVLLAGPVRGKRALVMGAGPIGLAVLTALRAHGAGRTAAAARSNQRREVALGMGADAYVLIGEKDVARVLEALGGMPDVVFECIGMPGALDACVRFVKPNGTVVSIGSCFEPDPVSVVRATRKQARLIFSAGYTLTEFVTVAGQLETGLVDATNWVSEVIALDAIGDAIVGLRNGTRGSIKLHVNPAQTASKV